jgi:hypothetical protein
LWQKLTDCVQKRYGRKIRVFKADANCEEGVYNGLEKIANFEGEDNYFVIVERFPLTFLHIILEMVADIDCLFGTSQMDFFR